jgi:hypothetical protein
MPNVKELHRRNGAPKYMAVDAKYDLRKDLVAHD